MPSAPRLISVAVPVPLLDRLTYAVPDHLAFPPVGGRVRVPLGPRVVTGCVVALGPSSESIRDVKPVEEVLDADPFLPPRIVDLCHWVAEYYMAGIGDAIGAALPPGTRRGKPAYKIRRVASITAHGLAIVRDTPDRGTAFDTPQDGPPQSGPPADENDVRLTSRQRMALDVLSGATAGLPLTTLRDRGIASDVVARLARRGLATIRDEHDERDPFERATMPTAVGHHERRLTLEQESALGRLAALVDGDGFQTALLHGVTGSGKTEIYVRLADRVCRAGRQVLLMVPEIALTPSVAGVFRGAFGRRVAIQHSGLSDGERHDQWQRIRRDEVDLVIGTRSAVFAPLTRLGLIIVDEEHDGSYKQEEAPRYHGRDVAIVRASREGATVVLGSATPSMESYQNAVTGKYVLVTLERRVLDRPLAGVRLVNMREEYAAGGPDVVISRPLAAAVEDRLARGDQVLVLLNRRGYATAVFCRQCGDTLECPNCSISLTVHTTRRGWLSRCHYCGYSAAVPKACRACAAPYLEQAGFGTERVEQHLRDQFPDARIGRVDRDSVRRKGALTALLSRFARGELDVLVGTQMIAKGHDFPRVTLVGVVSADVGLGLADFRAAERTFQLLTQVAGRAGRGERPGEAIVQTLFPDHYSIQLATRQDYQAFFDRELAYRRGMRYPPLVALVNAVVRGRSFAHAMQAAGEVVDRLRPAAASSRFIVLGPAPAPLTRLRGEHRVQFFLKGTRRSAMRGALQTVLAQCPELRRRVTVDVDPLNVL